MTHVIQFPNGRFGFAGRVPVSLDYPGATAAAYSGRKRARLVRP
jgi:hypothetical protein